MPKDTITPPTAEALAQDVLAHLQTTLAKRQSSATDHDWRVALSLAIRDRVVTPWLDSLQRTSETGGKEVYYLSLEFLIGRLIEDVTINLGLEDVAREAMAQLGQDYTALAAQEPDAALGNGGLGRLAACFMDSLSTLGIPAHGYGIRYEHGLFEQHFQKGVQVETAEAWLAEQHVWEFERPEVAYRIGFGGHVDYDAEGRATWHPAQEVIAQAYDTPTVGWQAKWVNTLRLWSAKPVVHFDLAAFNRGDYIGASASEALARTLSRVLYPDDTTEQGRELRLKQEYFFVAASLRDLVRRHLKEGRALSTLPDYAAIQLNDTHPALAGPELIRLLVDEHGMEFETAVKTARACLGYTNHTLLPEALERWSEGLMKHVLPRHYAIICLLNMASLDETGTAILDHGEVRMGELAFVMAHKVNGVSALHTELVKETLFADLHKAYPDRIVNQTNGVTPRRWLHSANPALSALITETIGEGWVADLERLRELEPHIGTAAFDARFADAKRANKAKLSDWLRQVHGASVDPDAMFDIQIKRIHEYKRQLLNILETVALWNDIRDNPNGDWTPRVKIFGGKAAPGYVMAKSIIRLINDVGATINADPVTRDLLQVVYPENYNVSMAERLIPACDLSEQISTAGKEASGTGNMKLSLNGALTIGTLDGANVEIREHVGAENFFLFGLTAEEVRQRRTKPGHARSAIEASPRLKRVLGQIANGLFTGGEARYGDILGMLWDSDYFLVTADFDSYYATQREIDAAYRDQSDWTRKAALQTARMGWFSSDRTISGYAGNIWNAASLL
ncbi:glycogen/starch/alpha-glucan phosphorylase [Jannaschia seohaensis]|uniref:Alpha-1,4 glucan phosphorylase n=1 Tax=Jannaschia seohaensis TaxID=475081 RepID=A0A2Y9AAS6_9RHOB|nr:glycogen/starch/alpha-glucan phosphorylase [Jannaschia seohaensis]PWJ21281.1 starch phosphorylase [Jannaschia seohaensis]SSA41691.1 starch phosphorylase [Jannaschia seohaensis]